MTCAVHVEASEVVTDGRGPRVMSRREQRPVGGVTASMWVDGGVPGRTVVPAEYLLQKVNG